MKITKRDRLILINQFRILASLNKNEADHYEELIDILENGYSIFYSQLDQWIADDTPEDEGRFVLEILELYRRIEEVKRVFKDPKIMLHQFSFFHGFDGNNETQYMNFCRFLIEKQGKFQEQKQYLINNDNLNSHTPMIEKYRRMLNAAKLLPSRWSMSIDHVFQVLEA